jgi:succinate dehydrogenase / fumarate reductase cytochrome b subunit
MEKALAFYETTVGKKVLMALTGLAMFGFVLGHMLGNLQVLLGPEAYNGYAVKLHSLGGVLWVVRGGLASIFVLHIWAALQLTARARAARPVAYRVKKTQRTTFAALTMQFSGITLLLFVAFHLAHFTAPGLAFGAYEHQHHSQVYTNFVNAFSVPWLVGLYIAAMVSLGLHLYHGSYSLLQTVGISNPLRNATNKQLAQLFALLVTVGNVLLPITVLLGLVR